MVLVSVAAFGQAPTVTSPSSNQVFYVGEKLEIRWQSNRSDAWSRVSLMLQAQGSGSASWIAFSTPNDGSFEWTVSKWATPATHFTITVSDGGSGTHETEIPIVIMEGTRPKPPQIVNAQIRKAITVEWKSIPGHTYRVEKSTDLVTWERFADDTLVEFEDAFVFDYTEGKPAFYRVTDLTPE